MDAVARRSASSIRAVPIALALSACLCSVGGAQAATRGCPAGTSSPDALDSLAAVVVDVDTDACAWLQLASARVAAVERGDLPHPGPLQPIGIDNAHGAGRAYMRALELDPRLLPAARGLVDVLTLQGGWPQEDDAARSLRKVSAAIDSEPPWLLLVRARLERRRGTRDSAAVLLRRYLRQGGDSGVGWLELARELYYSGDADDAHSAYLAGATHASSEQAIALYRQSFILVGKAEELAAFDSAATDSIGALIHHFWARRDASAGRSDGERLAEHYRRLEVAERSFRPKGDSTRLRPDLDFHNTAGPSLLAAPDSFDLPLIRLLDSTLLMRYPLAVNGYTLPGAVWIRQGPPNDFAGDFWEYDEGGRSLIIRVGGERFGGVCDLSTRYCGKPRKRWWEEWAEMLDTALTTDSYAREFAKQLSPIVNLHALLGDRETGQRGRVLVVFAVRAGNLTPRPAGSDSTRNAFPLDFRVIAYPPSGAERFEVDTTRWLTAPLSMEGDAWLTGTLELPLPAGLYNARVVIEESSARAPGAADSLRMSPRGVVVGRDSIIVSAAGEDFVMSDLVPGREHGLSYQAAGGTLQLNPLSVWPRGEPIELWYELAGLDRSGTLSTTVRFYRGTDTTHAVELRFTDEVSRERQAFQRTLDTRRLRPGHYVVEVSVVNQRGELLMRRANVEISHALN
ncbi:MAG TPA: hypothetical protein VFS94_02290 [Gemmatimonadales bacterium]|nr:hypothetical protein [Gemmatimonadales bacterium]